jgi:hypothetical protein
MGRRRKVSFEDAEHIRYLYHNTSLSIARAGEHFGLSQCTAMNIIDYKGAYAQDRAMKNNEDETKKKSRVIKFPTLPYPDRLTQERVSHGEYNVLVDKLSNTTFSRAAQMAPEAVRDVDPSASFEELPPKEKMDLMMKVQEEASREFSMEHLATVSIYSTAEILYEQYCEAVGGVAFGGDPLPSWEDFANNPKKEKQALAWMKVARTTITLQGP